MKLGVKVIVSECNSSFEVTKASGQSHNIFSLYHQQVPEAIYTIYPVLFTSRILDSLHRVELSKYNHIPNL